MVELFQYIICNTVYLLTSHQAVVGNNKCYDQDFQGKLYEVVQKQNAFSQETHNPQIVY